MKKKFLALVLSLSLSTGAVPAYAHSGRTDAAGGHHDYGNASGLGSYHYHHGYPAHLHTNGVCPYDSGSTSTQNIAYSSISAQAQPTATSYTPTNTPSIVQNATTIYVNGQRINSNSFVYGGTSYVPIRAISDAFGATVDYDAIAKTVTITLPTTTASSNAQSIEYNQALVQLYNEAYSYMISETSDSIVDSMLASPIFFDDPSVQQIQSNINLIRNDLSTLAQFNNLISAKHVTSFYQIQNQISSLISIGENYVSYCEQLLNGDSSALLSAANVVSDAINLESQISSFCNDINISCMQYLSEKIK